MAGRTEGRSPRLGVFGPQAQPSERPPRVANKKIVVSA